MIFKI